MKDIRTVRVSVHVHDQETERSLSGSIKTLWSKNVTLGEIIDSILNAVENIKVS